MQTESNQISASNLQSRSSSAIVLGVSTARTRDSVLRAVESNRFLQPSIPHNYIDTTTEGGDSRAAAHDRKREKKRERRKKRHLQQQQQQ